MARFPAGIFEQDNARPHTARVSQECLHHITHLPPTYPIPRFGINRACPGLLRTGNWTTFQFGSTWVDHVNTIYIFLIYFSFHQSLFSFDILFCCKSWFYQKLSNMKVVDNIRKIHNEFWWNWCLANWQNYYFFFLKLFFRPLSPFFKLYKKKSVKHNFFLPFY